MRLRLRAEVANDAVVRPDSLKEPHLPHAPHALPAARELRVCHHTVRVWDLTEARAGMGAAQE